MVRWKFFFFFIWKIIKDLKNQEIKKNKKIIHKGLPWFRYELL